MSQPPDLSVLIVNWNSVHFLEKCLRSVYESAGDLHFEVIVVDNASYDGSQEMLKDKFPRVEFIQNTANEGFAKANNKAFHHSSGRWVLFLNPDTEVIGPALATLLAFLKATPDAGIVGPKLLNSDGSVQITSIMHFPSLLNEALDFEFLHRAFPRFPLWNIAPLFERAGDKGVPVEAISGACMMMPRGVFEEVGMFDTSYFMFSEDLDLCYKVRKAGWKTYYCGSAVLVHHGGGSVASASEGFRTVTTHASHVEFISSRYGNLQGLLYRKAMALVAAARLIAGYALLISTLGLVSRHSLRPALARWLTVLRWAISAGHTEYASVPAASERQDLSRLSERHRERTTVPFPGSPAAPHTQPQGREVDPEERA
jgi:GT2 family glycosyltransferase